MTVIDKISDNDTSVEHLCVIGTGLIGGSFSLALKKLGACKRITGAGRTEKTLQQAMKLGVIDDYDTDIVHAVATADVIFVSVPLGAMRSVFQQIEAGLKQAGNSNAVITDAGSSKEQVQALAEEIFTDSSRFVAGHPIAGTEQSGPAAAFPELYQGRRVILTPTRKTNAEAFSLIAGLWQRVGAEVHTMDVQQHDRVLAATSHLPHLLAFALVDCLHKMDDVEDVFQYAAGGFRDFSRIASSDPTMWRDICLNNKHEILQIMQRYKAEMEVIYNALAADDGEKLFEVFTRAKQTRDNFVHK
jgi:prephenate dehydrogenase